MFHKMIFKRKNYKRKVFSKIVVNQIANLLKICTVKVNLKYVEININKLSEALIKLHAHLN